ncbi:ABC transporter ATP-binding protein [Desulfotignum phosphitoxidans]|uniref:Fe(3+)-transporting ATPase n=1 Tax=Desulfotignum phosphitoxidans DSM 13687 TaxID=1286635 RepID=S0G804_9BACT|nr:ABC transporter ATP-binding protein [Desulfotignum phosphitoxidans]EMS81346.1 Fe(3+)-transporting ATPase [Desulfotignum phosphitoxidans DSM 13687]
MYITLRHIGKSFKHQPVLESIGFAVNARELVSIVGPSGAGKTTLLKIIAGLEAPDTGQVIFSHPVTKHHPVIIVFQDYVLFPAMTVRQNIGFGLKARHMGKNQIKNQVDQMLDYFKLAPQADQYPAQLSAGQKQRVAIARAMIVNPAVLLLDEPFANLDRNLKMETARFIRTTQQAFGIPTISVTHDLEEAFAMSDRIGVLLDGRVQQFDTPRQVYFHSATPAVARFLGPVNKIPPALFPLFRVDEAVAGPLNGTPLPARPENLAIIADPEGFGRITEKTFAGHYTVYTVTVGSQTYTIYSQNDRFESSQHVSLRYRPF